MISKENILHALSHVIEPDLQKDLVTLNMIRNLDISGNEVAFDLHLTTPACPLKDQIKQACVNAIHHMVSKEALISIKFTSGSAKKQEGGQSGIAQVKNIIAVASGKGGVGKSTVAAELAIHLTKLGAKCGLLDADVYGPSAPLLFAVEGQSPESVEKDGRKLLKPIESGGVKILSMGFLVARDQAIPWRGPMVSSAVKQMVNDADWGELDYLIVDLPPGTGDVQITIAQSLPLSGVVIVTTPQMLAVSDARRAISMFRMQGVTVPILGIVENMSYFTPADDPSKRYRLFGEDGAKILSEEFNIPVIAQIPIRPDLSANGNNLNDVSETETNEIFTTFAGETARLLEISNFTQKTTSATS